MQQTRKAIVGNFKEAVSDEEYLQYAPASVIDYYNKLLAEDKVAIQQSIRYTPNSIDAYVTLQDRPFIISFAKTNLLVDSQEEVEGMVNHNGQTYFTREKMMEYTQKHNVVVPFDEIYEQLIRSMPFYNGRQNPRALTRAGMQLVRMLDLPFDNIHISQKPLEIAEVPGFSAHTRTKSVKRPYKPYMIAAWIQSGTISVSDLNKTLLPLRTLTQPPQELLSS